MENNPSTNSGSVPGMLNEADMNNIAQKYGIEIDPDSIAQYKLCQVIKYLEIKLQDKSLK